MECETTGRVGRASLRCLPLWLSQVCVLCLLLAKPAGVLAHEEGVGINGVIGLDPAGEPWSLVLSEGLWVRDGGEAWFLCPSAVGLEVPPIVAAGGGHGWLVGEDGLYRLSPAGELTAVDAPGWTASEVLELVSLAGDAYGLAVRSDGGVAVGRLPVVSPSSAASERGVEVLLESPTAFTSLAAGEGSLWLGASGPSGIRVTKLAPDGSANPWPVLPWPDDLADLADARPVVRLRAAGDALFAAVLSVSTRYLLRLRMEGAELLLETLQPLVGPVAGDAGVFVLDGNTLLELDGGELKADETDIVATYLSGAQGRVFLSAVEALYELPLRSAPRPLLSLDGLRPPPARMLEGDPRCQAQWLVFNADMERRGLKAGAWPDDDDDDPEDQADAGMGSRSDGDEEPDQKPASRDRGGCAVASGAGASGAPGALVLMLAAAVRRRRRRRAAGADVQGCAPLGPTPKAA